MALRQGLVVVFFMGVVSSFSEKAGGQVLFDPFGQSTKVDFSGKVKSEEELRGDVARDEEYYGSLKPPERDSYGGLPGSREKYGLKKTGFFHLEKVGVRQVLVTPEGNLYFMLGTGGVFPYHDFLHTKGREKDFEWLPPGNGKYKKAWVDKGRGTFSFVIANDIRKYGYYNPDRWKKSMIGRLRKWGFNGMNSYGRFPGSARENNYPTTLVIRGPERGEGIVSIIDDCFIDPFDEETLKKVEAGIKDNVEPYAGESTIIGWYLNNEQHFAYIPIEVPKLTGKYAAKRKLVEMLKKKYAKIERFNKAWGLRAKSFDDLLNPIVPATGQAGKDMIDYERVFLETYYKFMSSAFRKYDPNHLILGSRVRVRDCKSEVVNEIAGKYCDVLSVNYYTYFFNKYMLKDMHRESGGRPIILSEWDYDCTDQGLMNHLRDVKDQKERGLGYRNYVEQAASLPFIVGVQWWNTLDHQGSQWNTGVVNIADRPYKDFLTEAMKTNYTIYDVVLGKRAPYQYDHPNFKPKKLFGRKTVEVPRALPGMKVDGVQMPWPDRPSNEINAQNLVLGKDPGQIEGDFWLCWDEKYLYLYIDVQDPTPRMNAGEERGIWRGDAVELFLGSEETDKPGPLLLGDRQILISLGRMNPPRWFWANSFTQPEIKMAILDRPDGKGCILEAAVPFEAIGVKPKAGVEFLFDIGLDESSAETGNRDRQFMWCGTADNSVDRSGWGKARLSG